MSGMEALMETNAKSLVDHWTWAADKGVLNRNTAAGLRSACTRVLAVLGDDWEETDISRFGCREPRQTFREAVASCLEYLRDPGGWEPATQERAAAPQRSDRSRKLPSTTTKVYYVDGRLNMGWLLAGRGCHYVNS